MAKFSVLLVYPDLLDDAPETYYDFVKAKDALKAIEKAQRHASRDNGANIFLPEDFRPLLVIEGHHIDHLGE